MQAQHHLSSEDSAKLKIHIFQFLASISPPKEQYKITDIIFITSQTCAHCHTLIVQEEMTKLIYTLLLLYTKVLSSAVKFLYFL